MVNVVNKIEVWHHHMGNGLMHRLQSTALCGTYAATIYMPLQAPTNSTSLTPRLLFSVSPPT